jgi:uncharacterized FAD-dependent dehydrogenase
MSDDNIGHGYGFTGNFSAGLLNTTLPDISISSGGKVLLTLHADGTVTGNLDDTDEAAQLFVQFVRSEWKTTTEQAARIAELESELREARADAEAHKSRAALGDSHDRQ